jgi:adenylate cyclase class IV
MYEVEIKVELTAEEKDKLISLFKERGFLFKGVTPQSDFWPEAKESEYGGYDIKRYRKEADKYFYTEKMWELFEGDKPVRRENEHEVTKEEYESKLIEYPSALSIKKDREWFKGSFSGTDISITIDSVKFDHSPNIRYFLEAEIGVKNKEYVAETKELIRNFLKEILNRSELFESPGMFGMAFLRL